MWELDWRETRVRLQRDENGSEWDEDETSVRSEWDQSERRMSRRWERNRQRSKTSYSPMRKTWWDGAHRKHWAYGCKQAKRTINKKTMKSIRYIMHGGHGDHDQISAERQWTGRWWTVSIELASAWRKRRNARIWGTNSQRLTKPVHWRNQSTLFQVFRSSSNLRVLQSLRSLRSFSEFFESSESSESFDSANGNVVLWRREHGESSNDRSIMRVTRNPATRSRRWIPVMKAKWKSPN